MESQIGNTSGIPKELKRLLTKKDPKYFGYLKLPPKLFCSYVWKPDYVVSWHRMLKAYDRRQNHICLFESKWGRFFNLWGQQQRKKYCVFWWWCGCSTEAISKNEGMVDNKPQEGLPSQELPKTPRDLLIDNIWDIEKGVSTRHSLSLFWNLWLLCLK